MFSKASLLKLELARFKTLFFFLKANIYLNLLNEKAERGRGRNGSSYASEVVLFVDNLGSLVSMRTIDGVYRS